MEGSRKLIHSTCMGCIGNCGGIYEVENNKIVSVKGDPDHPLTKGYMCPKGIVVEEIRSSPERLTHPLKRVGDRGEGEWAQIPWDEAIDEIAEKLTAISKECGPEAVVFSEGYISILGGLEPALTKFSELFGSPNRMVDLHI